MDESGVVVLDRRFWDGDISSTFVRIGTHELADFGGRLRRRAGVVWGLRVVLEG